MTMRVVAIFFLSLVTLMPIDGLAIGSRDTLYASEVSSFIPLEYNPSVQAHLLEVDQPYEQVKQSGGWRPFDSIFIASNPPCYWLRFQLKNDSELSKYMVISHGGTDFFTLHITYSDSTKTLYSGSKALSRNIQFDYDMVSNSFHIPAGQTITIIALAKNVSPGIPHSYYLETREYYARSLAGAYISASGDAQFHSLVIGALLFSIFFIGFLSIWFREKSFIYYLLYVFGALLYLLPKTPSESFTGILMFKLHPVRFYVGEGLQYLFYAAYIAFGASLLQLSRYKRFYVYLQSIIGLFITYAAIAITYQFATETYQLPKSVFVTARIVSYVLCLFAVGWIWFKTKSPLKPFYVVGSLIFIVLTAWSAFSNMYLGIQPKPLFFVQPIKLFKFAVLVDTLVFAVALGYKMYFIEKEKRSNYKAYIQQLEVNRDLITSMNTTLEKTVAERTAELEVQKEKQLRLEYDRQITQLEMQALRSQMNPHFIFNSLNSIRYQIHAGQYKDASDYLLRFSRLLRMLLENTRRETVSLSEELELTRLYLEIEGKRFGEQYRFSMEVSDEVDTEAIQLPPMLLQPFAENSVKHGLLHSTRPEKWVRLAVNETVDGGIEILISDNGIGRHASAQLQQSNGLHHQSLGTHITQERMELFSQHHHCQLTAELEDLEAEGTSAGTLVRIIYQTNQHVQSGIS